MRILATVIACVALTACASGYQKFYQPYADPRTLSEVQLLTPGEQPMIFSSNDLDRDVKVAVSKGYRPVGHASFNGAMEDHKSLTQQAEAVGALLVLVKSKFAESRTITTPLFVPDSQTTYVSGNVYGSGSFASYSGTATTYGTSIIPITTTQQRFDQTAVFFVKTTSKAKFGLMTTDLTQEQRIHLERNTGAVVDVVREDSPAFVANILPGDVIIEIAGIAIQNKEHASEVMRSTNPIDGRCTIKVIRNSTERAIEVLLNKR